MKKLLTLTLAAVLLGACQQDENNVGAGGMPISISPVITRATEVDFETGDKIGLNITKADGTAYATNAELTYNGTFKGSLDWYAEGNDKSTLMAYYPYDSNGVPTTYTVQADQSTTGYAASDLMAATKTDILPTVNAVTMVFKHLLARIAINVDNESGSEVSAVTLQGALPTATLDLANLGATVDATSTATDITTHPIVANNVTAYYAIVVPQTVAFTVVVKTADGKSLAQKLVSTELKNGYQYNVGIRVLPDNIKVSLTGEISQWTDGGAIGPDTQGPSYEEHETYFLYDGVQYNFTTLANGSTWMTTPMRYVPAGLTPSSDPTDDNAHIWYPYSSDGTNTTALTDDASIAQYGYLYDMQAALGKEITADNFTTFEGAQGICPPEWHIPTQLEWYNLVGATVGTAPSGADANPLFYDATIKGAKATSLIDAINYQFTGFRSKNSATTAGSYNAGIIDTAPLAQWSGRPKMSYYMSSTAYAASKSQQFFGVMSTINGSYPEGRLTLSYSAPSNGVPLRCVKNPATTTN
ncbi:MAG: fimbrillin family protein [Mediterranea sp.]|jgi:uncharacterized protein (TIGR02145 family)|nr:fimbrillin family protein [Mediterranea sp.]